MKNFKKLALVFALAVPTVVNLSCLGGVGRTLWWAAVDGAANYVEGRTFTTLDEGADFGDLFGTGQ